MSIQCFSIFITDAKVPVWIKKGTFSFPKADIPVIMVGPGKETSHFVNITN